MLWIVDFAIACALEYATVRRAALSVTYSLVASTVYATALVVSLFAYRAFDEDNLDEFREQLTRAIVSVTVSVLLTAFIFTLFRSKLAFRPTALTSVVLSIAIPLVNHGIYRVQVSKRRPRRIILIAPARTAEKLKPILDEVVESSRGRVRFGAFVDVSEGFGELENFIQVGNDAFDRNLEVLFCSPSEFIKVREWLNKRGLSLRLSHVSTVVEESLKRIPLELVELFREYYELEFSRIGESPVKRIFDIALSLVGLVLTSPLLLAGILLIFLEDGKPVLYKQLRIGKYGRPFIFVKIRTLREARPQTQEPHSVAIEGENPNTTIEKRQLKVGRFLRLTRLDELPQFWLVLKGTMSIVGPRPEMVEYHEMFGTKIPYYSYRLNVRPGLTGWAQINYRHTSTLEEYVRKTEYDLYYVKNWSLLLDIQIILQTLEAVFWRRGAR